MGGGGEGVSCDAAPVDQLITDEAQDNRRDGRVSGARRQESSRLGAEDIFSSSECRRFRGSTNRTLRSGCWREERRRSLSKGFFFFFLGGVKGILG